MRVVILCLIYCLSANSLFAQQLEGKWKGYFSPNNSPFGKIYTYEMDITQGPQGQLTIGTFTKLSSDFSAHAYAFGTLDKITQLVHIEEQGFLDIAIQDNYTPCLMNNFLMYKNIRGHEIIEGTYTSYNKKTSKDCGGGKVYLEKELPIQKLIASEKEAKQKIAKEKEILITKETPSKIVPSTKNNLASIAPAKISTPKTTAITNTIAVNTNKTNQPNKTISTPDNINTAIQNAQMNSLKEEPIMEESFLNEPEDIETEIRIRQGNGFQTVPWALVARENKLAKKIITSSRQFSIDLYDNGTIDNDSIIVYDNKKLLVSKKRLSYKAIHLEFTLSEIMNEHEIIIVAHNMGTVPPNTALLVLKDGDKRQELFITSTNKINAKIIVSYIPPPKE